jgi:hypothetical protein
MTTRERPMDRGSHRGIATLCLLIALITAAVSGTGVFLRGDGETVTVISPRGERYEMVDTGIYRYNAQRLVAEGVGWDIFTLFLVVPALLIALPLLTRGSLRGRLFVLGLLAYLFYQYFMYAMTWAFGPLFLPFVVIYAASLAALVWVVSTIDLTTLPYRFAERFPYRGMAVFAAVMGVLLVLMWLGRIVPALGGEIQGVLLGQSTLVVQAMDLGLIVPLVFVTAVTTWRRRPVGYLLAPVVVVKAVAMAGAICAMLISAWVTEGSLEVGGFIIFAGAAAVSLGLGVRMYRSHISP